MLDDNPDLSDYNSDPDSAEAFWFFVLTDEDMPVRVSATNRRRIHPADL